MKHLLTAIACCFAVAGSAQFPYNPDSNGDNFIGSHDLLDFLPLYDSPFFATDSIVVQIVDSVTYVIDTCLYNSTPYVIGATDSICTTWAGDSIAQTVWEPYGDSGGGSCYIYSWHCYDSSNPYQLSVEIDENTDWVDWQLGYRLDLPADSSWKTLCLAASSSYVSGQIFSEGEYLGTISDGVTSGTWMKRIVVFVRDYKGTWYWQHQPNREEKTRLFDHGYYGDAAVISACF